jgi:hypothetical protein
MRSSHLFSLHRGVAAALAVTTLYVCPAQASGEPSEAEMRAAYEGRLNAINAHAQATAQKCNKREYRQGQGDPMLAMECLAYAASAPGASRGGAARGGVARGGVAAPQFQASYFRKIACEKAQGEPGYYCDYSAGMNSNLNAPPSMAGMMQRGSVSQARFVKRESGWLMMPQRTR